MLLCSNNQNPKYWEIDFVPSSGPTSDLWAKRNRKSDSNNSENPPPEPYHISTAHQKAVKMEIASVCRQWCCNIHPELTWMSRGRGWDLKPMWFWFSLWLKTIYPQDTFLLLCEGCEKLKDRVNLALGNTQPRISTVNQQKHLNYQVQFSSVAQSCPTLCNPMNCSMPGLPVHHQLPEFTQTHVHRVGDAI